MANRLGRNETGVILVGVEEFKKQLLDFDIIKTRGVSDAVHRQANRLASGIRMHPFVRAHRGLDRSILVGRFKKKSRNIGSFVRVDYDIAVENIKNDWPSKRWLPLTWEFGNARQTGWRFVTNTWLRLKGSFVGGMKKDIEKRISERAEWINQQVKRKTQGLR